MLSVNLEYFVIKNEMQNSINIKSHRNQTFTGDDGFYGNTNDHDANDYLALKYILFFTNETNHVCDVMFIREKRR